MNQDRKKHSHPNPCFNSVIFLRAVILTDKRHKCHSQRIAEFSDHTANFGGRRISRHCRRTKIVYKKLQDHSTDCRYHAHNSDRQPGF